MCIGKEMVDHNSEWKVEGKFMVPVAEADQPGTFFTKI